MNSYRMEPESLVTSTNGINIEYQQYQSPSVAIDLHIHRAIEILYIKKGAFEVTINNKNFIVSDGDLVLLKKYALHSIKVLSESGGGYYVLKIHPSVLDDFADAESISNLQSFFVINADDKNCIIKHNEFKHTDIHSAINALVKDTERNDALSFFSLKVNTGRLLLYLIRYSSSNNADAFKTFNFNGNISKTIQKAVDYINENYASDITALAAAQNVGLSYNYFSNCFSRVIGQTFKQYLNKTRINHAKHLLLSCDYSISEISELVGYNNVSYFILEFRKQTGITPSKFAKTYRRL